MIARVLVAIAAIVDLGACGDDLSYPDEVHVLDAFPDACVMHTDAEPASSCCALPDDQKVACVRESAQPHSCLEIVCFDGCQSEHVSACRP